MNLEQILALIADRYPDEDIRFLCDRMAAGDMAARNQLADAISTKPAILPPLMHLEISRWGITDEMSQCQEIRRSR